jgi:hypothetical protein
VNDLFANTERKVFGTKKDARHCADARFTLLSEQRILACQSASLARLSGAVPEQLDPLPGHLFSALGDLYSATVETSPRHQAL